MTDGEFVLSVLRSGEWTSLNEILRRSFAERGCGLTVHSRVSDLRAAGHVIEHRMVGRRGDGSQYRLLRDAAEGGVPLERRDTEAYDGRVGGVSEQLALVPEPPRGAYWEAA